MNTSNFLKMLLAFMAVTVLIYTLFVFPKEGADLLSVFLTNVKNMNWSGQFNLDFSCYLMLSGLWIMWRSHFKTSSIIWGLAAAVLGIVVFAPYLIYLLSKEKGDIPRLLVGDRC
ncbi:hypothetical protein [Paenimyroides aestuarii]|uniref:DUF2834 domain-containing protein n=1 Tax=Paenimyroides aestuarii TaxID=2968490 RepID=A0ABY5NUQ8_9FLAO|nr:hypothetical protein [Paenimyroides aestuarii]UUV22301.1 hypothetical protein NPX36_04500 [Paenimyroides aestuarii]